MERLLKTFIIVLTVSMLLIGNLIPAMAVSSKAYIFEDNLEIAMPGVSYEQPYVPGEILVKFNPGVSEASINSMNSKNGASVTYTSPYAGFKILKIPKTKSVEELTDIYSKNPNVEYASPNYIMHATMIPNDYDPELQWNFGSGNGINVVDAWGISTGRGVVVAVLDTGIAYNDYYDSYLNYDLANTNFMQGYDFINEDSDPTDDQGHGTHVAGTIAQSTNNGIGVTGVAFDCTLMPVKVLGSDGSGDLGSLVDGIYYATDNGAQVISMSLGFDPNLNPRIFKSLTQALDYADEHGVVIVAAAGNNGMSKIGYPAAYEKCIAVGATRYDGTRASYSNYGSDLDIMAPGGDIGVDQNEDGVVDGIVQSTLNPVTKQFNYYLYQGTSMATPHVSGVAALLIANGVTGPENVRAAIENSAQDIYATGQDADSGYGIVDAYAALNYDGQSGNDDSAATPIVQVDVTTEASQETKGTMVNGIATIYVSNGDVAVAGASITGTWSGAVIGTSTATTDSNGIATVDSYPVKYKGKPLTFIFTVNSVTVDGTTYDISGASDSDGYTE